LKEVIDAREKDIEHLKQRINKNNKDAEDEQKRLLNSIDVHRSRYHERDLEF